MRRLLTILPALLWFSLSFGQNVPDNIRTAPTPATGTNKNNKAQVDANLRVSLSFRIPSGPTETLNGAKDSIGYLFFNTTDHRLKVYRGSGVWDSYSNQADLGNYQPLLGYTAANDTGVVHKLPVGTPESKGFNLSGKSSIAQGGDLSLYSTTDQTVSYGRLRTYYSSNGFITTPFPGRSGYYISPEVGGSNTTHPDIVLGVDSNFTRIITDPSLSTNLFTYKAATNPTTPIAGNQTWIRYGFTSSATATYGGNGFSSDVRVSANNSKNWTSDPQGHPLMRGYSTIVGTLPGGTGLIPYQAGFYITNSILGASVTEWDGINVTFASNSASRLTYGVGARLAQYSDATNGTGLLLTNSDGDLPPTGYWDVYSTTGYNSLTNGYWTATGYKTPSGMSSQFLKADGSVDNTTYQASLGFTPENVGNKVTTLSSPSNTTYPTTKAVSDAIAAIPTPPVTSVFGRTGAVVAQAGDYSAITETLTNKNLTSVTNMFPTFNQNTTGNAATATTLQTVRTINGVSFNGSANVQNTTDQITEGSTNLYFNQSRVLSTPLTGYTLGTNTPILATDNLLAMAGKFQAQINSTNSALFNYWLLSGNNTATGVNTFASVSTGGTSITGNTFNLSSTTTGNNQTYSTVTINSPAVTVGSNTGTISYALSVLGAQNITGQLNGVNSTFSGQVSTPTLLTSASALNIGSAGVFGRFNMPGTFDGELLIGTTSTNGSKILSAGIMPAISGKAAGVGISNTLRASLNNDVLYAVDITATYDVGTTAIQSYTTAQSGTAAATAAGAYNFTGGTGSGFRLQISYTIGSTTATINTISTNNRMGTGYTNGDVLTLNQNGMIITATVTSLGLTGVKFGGIRTNAPINLNYSVATTTDYTQVLAKTSTGDVQAFNLNNLVLQVVEISGTTQQASANTLYIPHNSSQTTITLPLEANAPIGTLVQVVGEGSGGWKIAQNASQQIVGVGGFTTTAGTSGYVYSTDASCTITLRKSLSNKWTITSSQGTIQKN